MRQIRQNLGSIVLLTVAVILPVLLVGVGANHGDEEIYYPIREDGKWGYINASGEVVIEPQFDKAMPFHEGRAVVADTSGAHGFINTDGEVVIETKYDHARRFSAGLAPVLAFSSEKYGYVNNDGKMVISPQFPDAYSFSEGRAAVNFSSQQQQKRSWGYINKNGETIIEPQFGGARRFQNGLAPVAMVREAKSEWKWGYINKKGKKVIEPEYDEARPFSEGLAPVEIEEDVFTRHWGYINRDGAVEMKIDKELTLPFSEGLGSRKTSSGWQYIKPSGETVITGDWVLAEPFHGKLARVTLSAMGGPGKGHAGGAFWVTVDEESARYAYINRSGEIVWKEPKK